MKCVHSVAGINYCIHCMNQNECMYMRCKIYLTLPAHLRVNRKICTHPYKHAIMGQYRASTGPLLPESEQYWPDTAPYRHVYRDVLH